MTLLEIAAIILACGASLFCIVVRRALPWLLVASALTLAAALAVNPARWQLYPAAVALMLLTLLLRHRRLFVRTIALGGALLLLCLSAILSQLMAMPRLPAPTGPYSVGTISQFVERQTERGPRRLFLKLWYPTRTTEARVDGLWSDLQSMSDMPWYVRWGLAYLSRSPTHAHVGAPYAPGGAGRLLLYSHMFVSWASENSLLAEELASRGFIVIAIRHLGQFDEYRRLDARFGNSNSAVGAVVAELVSGRTADSRFVADRLTPIVRSIPHMSNELPKTYEAVGFSLGGAVVTSLCATDARCFAVANIDGAVPGVDYVRLPIPHYLMVYSGAGFRSLGSSSRETQGGYREQVFPEAAHADFHDSAVAIPMTRWFFGRTVTALEQERQRTAGLIADFLARATPDKQR